MTTFNPRMHQDTPQINILDNRGFIIQEQQFCRTKISSAAVIQVSRKKYNIQGQHIHSYDPRFSSQESIANFNYQYSLQGDMIKNNNLDTGENITLCDIEGRLVLQKTASEVNKKFEYENNNSLGRMLTISEQLPDTHHWSTTDRFFYAEVSKENQARNLCGQIIEHYDTAGMVNLESVSLIGIPTCQNRQLVSELAVDINWSDANQQSCRAKLNPTIFSTKTTTDITGALLTQTDAVGNQQRYVYNRAGQLQTTWLKLHNQKENPILTFVNYNALGQKLREEYANGTIITYRYELATQRLVGMMTQQVKKVNQTRLLQDLRYQYDPVGNILVVHNDAEETRFYSKQKIVPECNFTYDSCYQLIQATGRESSNNKQENNIPSKLTTQTSTNTHTLTNYQRHYSYDKSGNMTNIKHIGATDYVNKIDISECSNHGLLNPGKINLSTSHIESNFDHSGNQKTLSNGTSLIWNSRNELKEAIIIKRDIGVNDKENYLYDSKGERISKYTTTKALNAINTHKVIYLLGVELHYKTVDNVVKESWQVITAFGNSNIQVRAIHWEMNKPKEIDNDQIRYSINNLIGSTLLELDAQAQIISQEEYFPYGGTSVISSRNQIEASYRTIRYSGKERDVTGLYYYGYRYYQAWVGRWLSADPAQTIDGLNLYRMVRNNPIAYHDSNGNQSTKNDRSLAVIDAYTRIHEIKKSARQQIELLKSGSTKLALRAGTNFLLDISAAGINMGMATLVPLPGPAIISGLPGTVLGDITNRTTNMVSKKLIGGHIDLGLNLSGSTNKLDTTGVLQSYSEAFVHEHTYPFGHGEIKSVTSAYDNISAAVEVNYNRAGLAKKLYSETNQALDIVEKCQSIALNIINHSQTDKYHLSVLSRIKAWNRNTEYPVSIKDTIMHKKINAETIILAAYSAKNALEELRQVSRAIGYPAVAWGERHTVRPPSQFEQYSRRRSTSHPMSEVTHL
ncbi:TPA: RHS repeat domain-containing protein [Yersinia enterocolitica]